MEPKRAILTRFVEVAGRSFPPETVVWIMAESGDRVTIEVGEERRGEIDREALALAPLPPRPDNYPRAPAGKFRVIGQDRFSFEDPPYGRDFETLEDAREYIRKSREFQKDAGDLADSLTTFDDHGRVVH